MLWWENTLCFVLQVHLVPFLDSLAIWLASRCCLSGFDRASLACAACDTSLLRFDITRLEVNGAILIRLVEVSARVDRRSLLKIATILHEWDLLEVA